MIASEIHNPAENGAAFETRKESEEGHAREAVRVYTAVALFTKCYLVDIDGHK